MVGAIDPTALLAACVHADATTGSIDLDPDTVRALVAAYVERDTLRAAVERLRAIADEDHVLDLIGEVGGMSRHLQESQAERASLTALANAKQAWIDGAKVDIASLEDQVTALRAAVARMTGPEAVEAASRAAYEVDGGPTWGVYVADGEPTVYREYGAAAVRAITALGVP